MHELVFMKPNTAYNEYMPITIYISIHPCTYIHTNTGLKHKNIAKVSLFHKGKLILSKEEKHIWEQACCVQGTWEQACYVQ